MTAEVRSAMQGDADRRVLEFASGNRLVDGPQVARLLGVAAEEAQLQLSSLASEGSLVREQVGLDRAPWFRITTAGLQAVGSPLRAPGLEPQVGHALGAGWLGLVARDGMFGSVERVLTVREMESLDRDDGAGSPFAVRLEEFGGTAGLHYSDLMLVTKHGRIAVELLLTAPTPSELETVLRAYAADVRMTAVVCLVGDPWVGRLVQSVVAWLELSPMVHVQPATVPSV